MFMFCIAKSMFCVPFLLCLVFHPLVTAAQETQPQIEFDLTVVDETDDKPLADAKVFVINKKNQTLLTDRDGHVLAPCTGSSQGYYFVVELDGYVRTRVDWKGSEEELVPRPFKLSLQKATSIFGKVIDDAGNPVRNATVNVLIETRERASQNGFKLNDSSYYLVQSDDNGNWRYEGVPREILSVQLNASSQVPVIGQYSDFRKFLPSQVRDESITLIVPKGVRFEGVVLDKENNPLKGARVHFNSASMMVRPSFTDARGRFVFFAKEGVRLDLIIIAPGHTPEFLPVAVDRERQELTISLSESKPMLGRIVGPNEEPIPFAWIYPKTWRGSRSLGRKSHSSRQRWELHLEGRTT